VNNNGQNDKPFTQSILAKAFRGELVPTEAELARREGRRLRTRLRPPRTHPSGTRSRGDHPIWQPENTGAKKSTASTLMM